MIVLISVFFWHTQCPFSQARWTRIRTSPVSGNSCSSTYLCLRFLCPGLQHVLNSLINKHVLIFSRNIFDFWLVLPALAPMIVSFFRILFLTCQWGVCSFWPVCAWWFALFGEWWLFKEPEHDFWQLAAVRRANAQLIWSWLGQGSLLTGFFYIARVSALDGKINQLGGFNLRSHLGSGSWFTQHNIASVVLSLMCQAWKTNKNLHSLSWYFNPIPLLIEIITCWSKFIYIDLLLGKWTVYLRNLFVFIFAWDLCQTVNTRHKWETESMLCVRFSGRAMHSGASAESRPRDDSARGQWAKLW